MIKILIAFALVVCHVSLHAQGSGSSRAPEKPSTTRAAAKAGNQIQLPDLRIMAVKVDGTGKKMTVTVKNQCKSVAPGYRLELDIYKGSTKASGAEANIGTDHGPIKGGASADVVIDMTPDPGFGTFVGKFYILTVDPKNKIKEAVESNNTFQTSGAGAFPDGPNACDPK